VRTAAAVEFEVKWLVSSLERERPVARRISTVDSDIDDVDSSRGDSVDGSILVDSGRNDSVNRR
jgi:hypothetical protein